MDRNSSYERKPKGAHGCSGVDLPDELDVKRSDPAYNAHAYLTKVPIAAIEPFLEAFTAPGDVVLDMFGGSGMTGVAASILGRRAELRDISVLGRHIGRNYVNFVDEEPFREIAERTIDAARQEHGDLYRVKCGNCDSPAMLSRTVWTFVYECPGCGQAINYYEAFEAAEWRRPEMKCGACGDSFVARRAKRISEQPVLDTIVCDCSSRLRDQEHAEPLRQLRGGDLSFPDAVISEDRQMFHASALKKHGLDRTSAFFSPRNLAVLTALRTAIEEVEDEASREKLLFAFTAILTRASKRYQWHPKRPLNAANQNYYIAPVFYEWNVFDLFERKVEAALRSDRFLEERMKASGVTRRESVRYELGSADAIDLADESVDFVFTDPPFGSNIFYSDMNLFQEVWLDGSTDPGSEAVIDRSGRGARRRTAERYETLITGSLQEARRVLRRGGWLSIVFSNSSGEMWALLQRAIGKAGFRLSELTLLNKGQRSVKGLASGFESVVTMDLVLSMKKDKAHRFSAPSEPPRNGLEQAVGRVLHDGRARTPSHIYLELVRDYFRNNWNVSNLHIGEVIGALARFGYVIDGSSALVTRESRQAA